MSESKHAEVEEIASVAQRVRGVAEFTAEAAAYSVEADPDLSMWGAVGLVMGHAYSESSARIQAVLQNLPTALSGVAKRIEDSANSIADYDDEVKRSFDDLSRGQG